MKNRIFDLMHDFLNTCNSQDFEIIYDILNWDNDKKLAFRLAKQEHENPREYFPDETKPTSRLRR